MRRTLDGCVRLVTRIVVHVGGKVTVSGEGGQGVRNFAFEHVACAIASVKCCQRCS